MLATPLLKCYNEKYVIRSKIQEIRGIYMKRSWKNLIFGFAIFLFAILGARPVEAADTKKVSGMCMYDEAYEVLEIVNEKRTEQGLGKLTMDKDLLATAMLRAAEISVVFGHNRPNGETCFTANKKMYGENIAYGYASATKVMGIWMSSGGHRANIMNGEFNSIGIGCLQVDGVLYWVQCFGYCKADTVSQPANAKKTYSVSLTSGVNTKLVNPIGSKISDFTAVAGKNKLTLKWKKRAGVDGYQLQISTTKSFKTKRNFTIGKNTTKKVIKKYNGVKLKAKKRYYVRIRAFVKSTDEQGNTVKKYSNWNTINKKTK